MLKKKIYIFLLIIMTVFLSCKKETDTSIVVEEPPIDLGNSMVVHVFDDGCRGNGLLSFPSENIGYVDHCSDIYKTEDAGITWNRIFQFEHSIRTMDFLNENEGIVVIGYTYSEYLGDRQFRTEYQYQVLITKDGGNSWEEIYNTDLQYVISAVWIDDQTIIMNKADGIFQSIDQGQNWNLAQYPAPQNIAGNNNFDFINNTMGYYYSTNDIYLTEDKGSSWKIINSVVNYNPNGQEVDFVSISHGIRKEYKGIYYTTDGAKTWSLSVIDSNGIIEYDPETYIPPLELSNPYLINNDVSYFVGNEGVFKSSDGGINIKRIHHSKEINGKIYIVRKFSMFDELNGIAIAEIYKIPYSSHSYGQGDYAILRTTTGWQ